MKKQKNVDPMSFDDVPGMGPVKIKALQKEGYLTTKSIICKTPAFLKEVTGMDKDAAGRAFDYMKRKLAKAGELSPQEMTATELLKEREKIKRVSTGCKTLDNLLNGGVECKSITEFYGENGSGKTQISHTLAIQVQRQIQDGGLKEGKETPLVLYIDTEKTCRPERFVSILAGKKLIVDFPEELKKKIRDGKLLSAEEQKEYEKIKAQQKKEAEPYLNHIEVKQVTDAYQQFLLVQDTLKMMDHVRFKLIIVDSGTALFRSDYLGRGNTKAKFDLLNEMIHDLKSIAEHYNIPVIFVNQIYHKPDEDFGKDSDIPYGGNIVGHMMPYRIKLEKFTKTNKATIKKSPYQSNDEVKFKVTEAGLSDIE